MKLYSSQKHSIHNFLTTILLLCAGLIAAAGLTSCENFLDGGDVKREIEDAIAYNNAKQLTVQLYAQEGTGSTLPSGNYVAKQGYDFEISFSENPAYSFVKWTAVSKTDSKTEITDGITFEDKYSSVTNVNITNISDSIRIIPVCEKRIEVSGEPSPRYDPRGVSRDRSITVNFTKELAVENFFFETAEVPADATEIKKDAEGKIWAYVYEGQTYLKNILITNIDDFSIAEHFTCPEIEGKLLTIGVDKTNPIKFNSGEIYKTVKVSLSKNITDTLGIKMNSEKSWNYQITESTDEKANVTLTSVATEGSVYLAGTKEYSLGQKITLSFTEDADYQFVKWDYDDSIIYVAEPDSANTTATILEKTSGEESTQIKAVCAPRLRVTKYSPVTDNSVQTVSKNSSIVISFNHKLPDSQDDFVQLQNISITIGGTPVKSSFKAPSINEDTITFTADNSNMLDVSAGQKKTVSVTIPSDFYYIHEDGTTKITYGGNGKSFDYKIDDTTLDKAEITFTAAGGSGELTAASGTQKYSIGQEVPLVFVPASGWTFNGWTVMCDGLPVEETKIKIADVNAPSTKLTVYEALAGVTVRAKTSRCLEVSETSPSAQTNPKDSSIVIKFNQNLAADCASAVMLNKIEISSDVKLDSYYTKRTLNGDTITIENTSPISVPKGATKVITVTVPSDFYYINEGTKINLTEKSFSFKVDYTTNAKAKVTYQVIDGETGSAFAPATAAGTIEGCNSYEEYNIGEDAELSFALNSGYQFYGWKVKDADSENGLIMNQVSFKNSTSKDLQPALTFNEPIDNLVVNVICYKRPVITSVVPSSSNSSNTFEKNVPIEIEFDHKICDGTENEILVGYTISSFSKSTYYETSLNSAKNKISLNPIKMLPVEHAYETVTVTVPCEKVFYLAEDGKTKITPGDSDYIWSFKVNNTTLDKTEVRMDATSARASIVFKVNDEDFTTGHKEIVNMEQSINLEYPVSEDYAFFGWQITTESEDYEISPTGYVSSGVITVTKDEKEYCKLSINADSSQKAVFTSTEAIGNGIRDYALTVSVKDIERPKITSVTPSTGINPKDSEIKITFNKPLFSSCNALLDDIKIALDGVNVDSFFEDRSLSGNIISIKNTELLDVPANSKKTITVKVPPVFYYKVDNSEIYLAKEQTFEYKIDSSTEAKTKLRFDSSNNSNKKLNVNGTETNNGTNGSYNIGETVNLEYALPNGYKFAGWKISPVSSAYTVSPATYVTSGTITVSKNSKTYFTLTVDSSNPAKAVAQSFDEIESSAEGYGLSVFAKDVVLPVVSSFTPSANVNAKNSAITIKFNKPLTTECSSKLDKIKITMDGDNVNSFFGTYSLNSDTITFENTKLLDVTGTTTKTVTVTIPANVFYYKEDGLNVYMSEEKVFSYVVNSNTTVQTKVRFYSTDSSYKKLNVNGTETNNGTVGTYNMGETVNLEYALPSDYKFLGWKILPYSSSYSVSSSDYVTKGTITVTKNGQTYFTLKINDSNPTKATVTCSYGTISGSSYGLTVMTKDTLVPKIESITPAYKELGVRCDSPITITFNKAMDKSTLVLDDTILIPNPDGSNSPKGYGFVRSFADIDESSWNGNKLTLKPRKGSDCSYYIRGADVADVTVKLVSTRIKDTYGFMLSSENTTYTYRINKEKETTKPTVTSLGVFSDSSKTHSYTSQAENYWKSTQDGDYKYGDYSRNHAGGSFYFSVTGYDDDSGLKKLVIKETLLNRHPWYGTLEGVNATSDPNDKVETEYNLSDLTLVGTETKNGHTYYTYTGTHEMKCLKDGFFDVAFSFTDVVGNISYSNSLHLIKDTKIDESVIKFTEFASDSAITQRSETTSGDKVVMTFDETAKDVFLSYTYGQYTSTTVTYNSDFDISVKWGYAEDSITNTATKSGNQFSFTRDATKLTFVKIICKDEVNNVKEIIRIIPPRPDYDYTCINYDEKNSNYTGRIFKFTPFSYSSLKTLASYYDAELEIYMSRQINTYSTYTDVVPWNADDSRLLSEGNYYYLRPIYVLKYKDGSVWYSSINASYRTYIKLETDVTSSSKCTCSISPVTTAASSSPSIPTSVDVEIEFLWSTGLCKVMIDESDLDSNWNWSYKLVNYYDSDQIETFNTPTFYVSCPRDGENKYYVYFIAKRKSDGYVYTKSSGISLSTQCINKEHKYGTTGSNNLLTLRNDVNPPSFANAVHHVEYSSIIYTTGPEDDRAMYTENGKGVIECYLAPNLSSTATDFDNYTLEELENSSFTKITAKYSDVNNIIIPLDGINEGFYTACVVSKDSYGNKAVQCFPLKHDYRLDYPYTITGTSNPGVKLTATFLNYQKNADTALSFFNYNTTSKKWVPDSYFSTSGHAYWAGNANYPAYVQYNPASSSAVLGSNWLKIIGQVNTTYTSSSDYTQVDYIYTPNLTGSVTCNQKNVLQGLNGLQIFCDKSTLVHTFYSSGKITETANQDDILKWEMLGVETGITTNSSNFTYGSENFEEIPAGYYYTTVVHFADGTTVMSEVKQK